MSDRVYKCKTQLEFCKLWYVLIIVRITLRYKISKTTHGWCFLCYFYAYLKENGFLLFYYIYFIVVLKFLRWWIQKTDFLGANFLVPKSGCCHEKHPAWLYMTSMYKVELKIYTSVVYPRIKDISWRRYFSISLIKRLENY